MHNQTRKRVKKKGTEQEKVCSNLFNRLPVKVISKGDDVFDYHWCVLKESVRGCVPSISHSNNYLR